MSNNYFIILSFAVEIHNIMRHKTSNRDIFERDTQSSKERWQHLDNERVANLAEKFLQVTLKMLNVLVHLIEEVNPNVHLNKGGIALPGSPVRRKTTGISISVYDAWFYLVYSFCICLVVVL